MNIVFPVYFFRSISVQPNLIVPSFLPSYVTLVHANTAAEQALPRGIYCFLAENKVWGCPTFDNSIKNLSPTFPRVTYVIGS